MTNPYQSPEADVNDVKVEVVYVGFWLRVAASIIDTIIIMAVTWPILFSIYGKQMFVGESFILGIADFLLSYVFPAIAIILFWVYKSATPGKMAVGAEIVDAKTFGKPSKGQLIGRYFGYYVSILPLMLGIIWVAFDRRKQGWHDKLAGTVVIQKR